jgi:hypothetical protein
MRTIGDSSVKRLEEKTRAVETLQVFPPLQLLLLLVIVYLFVF